NLTQLCRASPLVHTQLRGGRAGVSASPRGSPTHVFQGGPRGETERGGAHARPDHASHRMSLASARCRLPRGEGKKGGTYAPSSAWISAASSFAADSTTAASAPSTMTRASGSVPL